MVFIWGRQAHWDALGVTPDKIECPSCREVGHWVVAEFGKRATIYFIPTFKYNLEYGVMCSVCLAGVSFGRSKQDALAVVAGTKTDWLRPFWRERDPPAGNGPTSTR